MFSSAESPIYDGWTIFLHYSVCGGRTLLCPSDHYSFEGWEWMRSVDRWSVCWQLLTRSDPHPWVQQSSGWTLCCAQADLHWRHLHDWISPRTQVSSLVTRSGSGHWTSRSSSYYFSHPTDLPGPAFLERKSLCLLSLRRGLCWAIFGDRLPSLLNCVSNFSDFKFMSLFYFIPFGSDYFTVSFGSAGYEGRLSSHFDWQPLLGKGICQRSLFVCSICQNALISFFAMTAELQSDLHGMLRDGN